MFRRSALVILALLAWTGDDHAASVAVFAEKPGPGVRFAMGDLERAFATQGDTLRETAEPDAQFVLVRATATGRKLPALDFELKPEGFCLRPDATGKV